VLALEGHPGVVRSAAFSPDGLRIVTSCADATARVWDTASGVEVFALKSGLRFIGSVGFSPDGSRIVTAGDTVRIWDACPLDPRFRSQSPFRPVAPPVPKP
jgi:WD40 repeat protein